MTEVLAGWEPIIDTAIASLREGLPAQIAAYNARPEAVVQLEEPRQYAFGGLDPLVDPFPVIEVGIKRALLSIDDITGQNIDTQPTLAVCVWHEGERGDLERTYRMSLGLGKCMTEVLLQPDALGPNVDTLANLAGAQVEQNAGALPEGWYDTDSGTRDFRKWRVPFSIRIVLPGRDGFSPA